MKFKVILFALLLTISSLLQLPSQAGQWVEPPEYPEGSFCTPMGDSVGGTQTPNHPCHCKRMQEEGKDKDCCNGPVHEDWQHCNQGCHPKKCACPATCTMEHHEVD